MSPEPDTIDPAEAMLAELAGLDLSLARHVHACAVSTDNPHEVAELAGAYQRISRCVRQSLALHARLKREREAAERASAPPPEKPRLDWARIARRQAEVREAVCRVIWDETETESFDEAALLAVLDNTLRITAKQPDFCAPSLDDHVLDVAAQLELPLDKAANWRDLPDLGQDDDEADVAAGDDAEPQPAFESSD